MNSEGRIELTREHKVFLERLITDDQFRSDVENDPARVLREHDIAYDANSIPAKITLPSKEELGDKLEDHLRRIVALTLRHEFFRHDPVGGPRGNETS